MLFSQIVDGEGNGLTEKQTDELLFGTCYETVNKSDYAIVLGTAPEYAAVRARVAAEFYHSGGTANLVVSGAAVWDTDVTEAAVMRNELIKHGVPDYAVIEEPNACDTVQNMICSLTEICKRRDIMTVDAVTVISEPFHMRRSMSLAQILLPNFIRLYGYTSGTAEQRAVWKTDVRLHGCVRMETRILRQLVLQGRIKDIELNA